jgi:hypothetical protein
MIVDLNNMQVTPDELQPPEVSPSWVADFWNVHPNTIYRSIQKGDLRARKLPNGTCRIAYQDAKAYGAPVVPRLTPVHPRVPIEKWRREELVAAAERSDGMCALCGSGVDLSLRAGRHQPTLDHIVPQSKGGGHERENLQLAHRGCNSRKRDKCDASR